jgi:hypothetical protein
MTSAMRLGIHSQSGYRFDVNLKLIINATPLKIIIFYHQYGIGLFKYEFCFAQRGKVAKTQRKNGININFYIRRSYQRDVFFHFHLV